MGLTLQRGPDGGSRSRPALQATVRLLYRCNPRAFVISSLASLTEPWFFPTLLLVLRQLVETILGLGGTARFTPAILSAGGAVVALVLVGIIVRDSSCPFCTSKPRW